MCKGKNTFKHLNILKIRCKIIVYVFMLFSVNTNAQTERGIIMEKFYSMEIAGCKRDLELFKVNDNLYIAAFIIFGDVEMTKAAARELLKKAPEYDIMVTAESKSIPLIYEMASQAGDSNYVIARKAPKVYMKNIVTTEVNSITTKHTQNLCLGEDDANALKGKRVLIVDDVISTGDSLEAIEHLVKNAGGNIVGKMAVLAEGAAANRDDIIFLEKLPLFDGEGNILE